MSTVRLVRAFAFFKLAFGVLELATGIVWLLVAPGFVQEQLRSLVAWMASQQPGNPFVQLLERQLPTLFAHAWLVAIGLILLGAVKVAGALGFLTGWPWGYWLFVASLAVLLPMDVRSAAADGSPLAWCFAALDVAVLAALLWFRRALISRPAAA